VACRDGVILTLLAPGVVPAALLERCDSSQPIWTLQRRVTEYLRNNPVPDSDVRLLDTILVSLASVRTVVCSHQYITCIETE
jgi:hypothetical protein